MLDKKAKQHLRRKNIVVIMKLSPLTPPYYRATVTEEEIKEAFTASSFEVKAFKFFP